MKPLQISGEVRRTHSLISRNQQSGFTLLELVITIMIASILGAFSYPVILNQIGKARVTEARNGLGAINRAQQAYLFEFGQFATSIANLHIDFSLGAYEDGNFVTKYYVYSVRQPAQATEVHHLAQPISGETYYTRSVVSAVYHQPTFFAMVICEATLSSVNPTIVDRETCNNGRFLR